MKTTGFTYQYEEAVLLRLSSQRTGSQPLKKGQRAYFDNTSLKFGKRVVGISLPYITAGGLVGAWNYNGVILPGTTLGIDFYTQFCLTCVDTEGNVVLWHYPLMDLTDNLSTTGLPGGNFGKIRKFDFNISMKHSYIIDLVGGSINNNLGILFNFYTKD